MKRMLSGIKPTGRVTLGNYIGAIKPFVQFQNEYEMIIFVANLHSMTIYQEPKDLRKNTKDLIALYIAAGLDPEQVTLFLQSDVLEHAQLGWYLGCMVSMGELSRMTQYKDKASKLKKDESIGAGIFNYPSLMNADILLYDPDYVPVGEDQIPMIEQTNEIVRRLNRQIGHDLLPECKVLLSNTGRLPGFDGKAKMSKSLGNTIVLDASDKDIKKAVNAMYTDPNHLRIEDPGQVEGNIVFAYLDAFDTNKEEVAELKAHYQRGGLGDGTVKKRLEGVLKELITPIRERRMELAKDPDYIMDILKAGTDQCRIITQETLDEVKNGLGVFHF